MPVRIGINGFGRMGRPAARADAGLYRAKGSGRNHLVVDTGDDPALPDGMSQDDALGSSSGPY